MATAERPNAADFYEREVLPALYERLDDTFPEFGWQRDPRGWHATDQEFTHSRFGVRADRIVCHGEAPRGFLIHGQGPVLWTRYVNDGRAARGRDFIEAVRSLADRVGLNAEPLDRPPTQAERKADLLHDAYVLARRELASERGAPARNYLERRGIPRDRLGDVRLGVMPDIDRLRLALTGAGYRNDEIEASGLLADSRWPGRIVGAWRNEQNRVATLWARTVDDQATDRYLYLRGAPRAGALPYGMSDLLASTSRDDRTEVTLVEGVMDVPVLHANSAPAVAALGGATIGSSLFERIADHGLKSVVLAFDNDDAGRTATITAINLAVRSARSPDTWVIDPARYGSGKDPGDLIRNGGAEAWRAASAAPCCAVTWRAVDLSCPNPDARDETGRRAGLARAAHWLGSLPPRLAIEQTAALDVLADSLDYDRAAVRRSFRARYWQRDAVQQMSRGAVQAR